MANGNMLDRFRLDGRIALVTGGGKGIGAGIAMAFAQAGADVAVVARTEADVNQVADQIRSLGRKALALTADISDLAALPAVVEETVAKLGGLDTVVNNAGGCGLGPFLDMSVTDLQDAFRFNVFSPFELCRLAAPHMLRRGGGAIVNIGSMAGPWAERGYFAYSLVKSTLGHLTRVMASDLSPRIRVNMVVPGAVETDALRGFLDMMPETREKLQAGTGMRRTGQPEDIAAAVLFFASPASAWVTGKLLEVDGAASAGLFPMELPDL